MCPFEVHSSLVILMQFEIIFTWKANVTVCTPFFASWKTCGHSLCKTGGYTHSLLILPFWISDTCRWHLSLIGFSGGLHLGLTLKPFPALCPGWPASPHVKKCSTVWGQCSVTPPPGVPLSCQYCQWNWTGPTHIHTCPEANGCFWFHRLMLFDPSVSPDPPA